MKLLPIFFTLFLVLSSSMVVAVATPPVEGTNYIGPPGFAGQEIDLELNLNYTDGNSASLWTWDNALLPAGLTLNITPGAMEMGESIFNGTIANQSGNPVSYSFQYTYTFIYGKQYDMVGMMNLTSSSGKILRQWGILLQGSGTLFLDQVSGQYDHSIYGDSLVISIVNDSANPRLLWYPMLTIHFTPQVMYVYHNQTIYHNSTVSKPYIPWIVYVVIGVLLASTIGFGIQGHEDEEKLRRRY